MTLVGKKVLVTGADGFIGSHLAEELAEQGADVRALVLYNSFGNSGWLDRTDPGLREKMQIVAGDVRDPHLMLSLLDGVDVVFHLASLIAIPYSYRAPDSYVATNVMGTTNIMQAALANKVSLVVHTSTSEIYGSAQSVPMNESHPQVAQSPYAATKIAADQIALSFHRSFDLPVIVVRPFNCYGPRQSARAIIPTVICQLLSGRTSIRLGNLSPTRDFTYVSDTVNGFIRAGHHPEEAGQVVHVGSGREISIEALTRQIASALGQQIQIVTDGSRVRPARSEVTRLVCDASRAERLLGWTPTISMEEGLRRTIEWMQKNINHPGYSPERYVI